jgi:MoaA/NifB/PqqE/SkfB family radical SAM enzyme
VKLKDTIRTLPEHLFLLRERPVLLPRLVQNYARMILLRRPLIRGVEFAVTYRCQLDCRHCLRRPLVDPGREELSPQEVRDVCGALIRLGALNINLTGGEPLLREDILEVVRLAWPNRCFLTLATNGQALTLPLARGLRRAGVRMLSLSLDGTGPDSHDRSRGVRGSHEAVMKALETARRAGLRVSVCTIVTREMLRDGSVPRMLQDIRGRAQQLTLNMPYMVGGWADRDEWYTEEDRRQFRDLLRLPGVRWEGSSNYFRQGCPAGVEKIYITPYGDVMPCACVHASYGNVRERPLEDIYVEMRRTPIFRGGVHAGCLVAENPLFSRTYLEPLNRLARADPAGGEGKRLLESIDPSELRR